LNGFHLGVCDQHHEAYVLWPDVKIFGGGGGARRNVIWTKQQYEHILSSLDLVAPSFDAVRELLPEQLVVVQKPSKFRDGHLLSVRYRLYQRKTMVKAPDIRLEDVKKDMLKAAKEGCEWCKHVICHAHGNSGKYLDSSDF